MFTCKQYQAHFPSESENWWKMLEDPRVVDLQRQLSAGLIHPVEYAHSITIIAGEYGLPEASHA